MFDPAPFFDKIADGPPGGGAYWLRGQDGVRIRAGLWPGGKRVAARGTVLLFPGRTEYIEKYGPVARDLAAAGLATLTVDWRGQGLADRTECADRMTGHIQDYAEYQTDIAALMDAADRFDLPRPFFLLAHSMGGCIGLRALHEGLQVKCAVFSAPMWGISIHPALRPFAWGMSWLSHHTSLGCNRVPGTGRETYVATAPFEGNQLTTDRVMYDLMQRQARDKPDLTLGGPSSSWLFASLSETRALQQLAPPDIPTLTFLGTNERIVDPRPIRDLMQRWPNGQLEIVNGAEHEVLMEGGALRQQFNDGMLAHFLPG